MYWGFSEAINLHEEYIKNITEEPTEELNILLFGSGDPRNILQTISKLYKHSTKINFYCLDGCIEHIARNMLLLMIAFESPDCLTLKNKTHLFMDVYGNSLLRPISNHYVASKSHVLRNIITDSDYMEKIVPVFNIDQLKYRERDGLEESYNFWLPRSGNIFDIVTYWKNRNVQLLGNRYDTRDGAFDWDLNMCLKDHGATQICSQEYKYWRDTGIAFTFPEYEQCCPNKTLVTSLSRNGQTYNHRGYVGDILVGPFCTFGLKCKDEKMLKSFHGTNDYRSTDVTERNLNEIFYEIKEKCEYIQDPITNNRKLGSSTILFGKTLIEKSNENVDLKKYDKPIIPFENLQITFLSIDDILTLQKGLKFVNFFDIIFIAHNYYPFLETDFQNIFKDKCLILFETKLFTITRKEQMNEYLDKIKTIAKKWNLKPITNFNVNIDYSIVKYKTEFC